MIGTDGFQEADICGITMPITSYNFLVTGQPENPQTIAAAFTWHRRADRAGAGGYPQGRPRSETVRLACRTSISQVTGRPAARTRTGSPPQKLIAASRRPVLYVGGGC